MKLVVGVGDMKVSSSPQDELVTHALGSCIGVAAIDPEQHVAGLLHFMLPLSSSSPERAKQNPYMFADTGIPVLLKELFKRGCTKKSLQIKVAGGAQILDDSGFFQIGKRNIVVMRKFFWKNQIMISGENLGGTIARTMHIQIGDGRTWITVNKKELEL
jgi:chemotaxis protein CheD